MKKLAGVMICVFLAAGPLPGQETRYPTWYDAYAYFGRDNHSMGQTAGLGIEGSAYRNLGLELELGVAGLGAPAVLDHHAIGIGSADATYRLYVKSVQQRVVPFVAGGYTPFFGQDIKLVSGKFLKYNIQHGYNFGAGIDIFPARHVGARLDVRYYGHGGRIEYSAFPNLLQLNFTAVRFALVFR